jgi:hypothetical protein
MKKIILITALLLAAVTKSEAQVKKAVEIENLGKEFSSRENNEFKITANEEVDVNLQFQLKKEDSFNVLITDEKNKVVFSRMYYAEGENNIAFTMDENEQYTVKLSNPKLLTTVVVVTAEN